MNFRPAFKITCYAKIMKEWYQEVHKNPSGYKVFQAYMSWIDRETIIPL